tara:strand:+ start:16319 stop:16564 length:246 start_codon:yes stop_codon:yes gene_type:complete
MISEDLKNKLSKFIGKNTANVVEKSSAMDNTSKEVCDLDTGVCYTVRTRDGLIERNENGVMLNKKVQVESPNGDVKQLLNG